MRGRVKATRASCYLVRPFTPDFSLRFTVPASCGPPQSCTRCAESRVGLRAGSSSPWCAPCSRCFLFSGRFSLPLYASEEPLGILPTPAHPALLRCVAIIETTEFANQQCNSELMWTGTAVLLPKSICHPLHGSSDTFVPFFHQTLSHAVTLPDALYPPCFARSVFFLFPFVVGISHRLK